MEWNDSYKDNFILDEFFMLSIAGAFQRNAIYSIDINEQTRSDFRKWLKDDLSRRITEYQSKVLDEKHIENISDFKKEIEKSNFKNILKNNQISFGTCQKLFNLFLKYYWAINKIQEPPHCPFDRIILEKLLKSIKSKDPNLKNKKYNKWTTATKEDYRDWIKDSKKILKADESLAKWEMYTWTRR